MKDNEKVQVLVELASFKVMEPYQISFLEKAGEFMASAIASAINNEKTQLLLEQLQTNAEKLSAQEEELRQNMEEMEATQEEMSQRKGAGKAVKRCPQVALLNLLCSPLLTTKRCRQRT